MESDASFSSRAHACSLGGASGTGTLNFDFNDASAGLALYWNSAGTNIITTGSVGDYTDTTKRHFMCVRSGTTMELFINNVSQGTSTSGTSFTTVVNLGMFADAGSVFNIDAKMDEFIYAHSAFNSTQRQSIFDETGI